jgi:acyl-CoA synthetase (NDP forming)
MSESRPELLEQLLAPRTIAVVGASGDPSKLGGKLIQSLRRFKPAVRIVGVSPSGGDGDGEWATSLSAIDGPVDQVLLCIPAQAVSGLIQEAGALGAKTAVVYASGFGETGTPEGEQLSRDLEAAVAETGVRVLGPNCLGYTAIRDTGDLVMAAWFGTLDSEDASSLPITPDPIALVSQSGGVGSMIIGHLRSAQIWPRDYLSTGNEYDLSLIELVRTYAADPGISVIGVYLEGVQHQAELADAFATARRAGKAVVCMVGGRSPAGGRAVTSHSGRLAQEGDLYTQFLEHAGASVAAGPWEMALILESAVRGRQHLGKRAGVICASGGMGTVTADLLTDLDFDLPEISAETADAVREQIPSFAQAGNPLDIGGITMQAGDRMPIITTAMLNDPALDLLVVTAGSMNAGALSIAGSVISAAGESDKPCVVFWPHVRDEAKLLLWEAGIACFTNEADLRLSLQAGRRPQLAPSEDELTEADPIGNPSAVALRAETTVGTPVPETVSKRIMQILGFEIPKGAVVTSEDELARAIRDIDLPVVLKGHAPSAVHKAELGLVEVNLRHPAIVSGAFQRIQANLAERGLGNQVLVEKYWAPRFEVLMGWSRTPLGTLVLFGTGGSNVEAIGDVHKEFLPLTDASIDRLLEQTAAGRVLLAQAPAVADRLRTQLRRIGQLAQDTQDLDFDLDVNPVAITELGRLVVLDAVFTPASSAQTKGA